MVSLRELARYTGKDAGVDEDTVEGRAWLVWKVMLGKAQKDGRQHTLNGVDGWTISTTMKQQVRYLWPLVSEKQALKEFCTPIYQYLKRTHNAYCIESSPGRALWWIRTEFNNVDAIMVPVFRSQKPTRAEKKLTPNEAGEDRAPGEVTVTKEPKVEIELSDVQTQILEVMAKADFPLVRPEIAYLLGRNDPGLSSAILTNMETLGLLHHRRETREEKYARKEKDMSRPAYLWWTTPDIPQRTQKDLRPGLTVTDNDKQLVHARQVKDQRVQDSVTAMLEDLDRDGKVDFKAPYQGETKGQILSSAAGEIIRAGLARKRGRRGHTLYAIGNRTVRAAKPKAAAPAPAPERVDPVVQEALDDIIVNDEAPAESISELTEALEEQRAGLANLEKERSKLLAKIEFTKKAIREALDL